MWVTFLVRSLGELVCIALYNASLKVNQIVIWNKQRGFIFIFILFYFHFILYAKYTHTHIYYKKIHYYIFSPGVICAVLGVHLESGVVLDKGIGNANWVESTSLQLAEKLSVGNASEIILSVREHILIDQTIIQHVSIYSIWQSKLQRCAQCDSARSSSRSSIFFSYTCWTEKCPRCCWRDGWAVGASLGTPGRLAKISDIPAGK